MQQAWKDFLKDNTLDSGIDVTNSPVISPLLGIAMLTVSGDDRHNFLHSQFMNDLNLIESPSAQLSAWSNPKGQVITNFIIINTGISYLLIFKEELKDYVQKRLTMFVLRSDVKIEDISESSPLVGIANIHDLSVLTKNIPKNAGKIIAIEGIIIVSHPDNSGRYLITGNTEALINKLLKLDIKLSNNSTWELLDILSGLPWITKATQEQFLPQMLNLDILKGLSYQKGCYPGQEVIARLHYRGEVKKRLSLIKSEQPLTIGEQITSEQPDSKAGSIINSASHSDGLYYALAVINLSQLNDKLTINNNTITVIDLPDAIKSQINS